jgi:hypothetical protein
MSTLETVYLLGGVTVQGQIPFVVDVYLVCSIGAAVDEDARRRTAAPSPKRGHCSDEVAVFAASSSRAADGKTSARSTSPACSLDKVSTWQSIRCSTQGQETGGEVEERQTHCRWVENITNLLVPGVPDVK